MVCKARPIIFAAVIAQLIQIVLSIPEKSKATNILFIMYDDLRPELSPYGMDYMITPNFQRLAQRSVIFDNAYCQIAVCNPSRDSMLTGLRPDRVGTLNFEWTYRFSSLLTLPSLLKTSGYKTAVYGKVLHYELTDSNVWDYHNELNTKWYQYQNYEREIMNSTTMPDRKSPESSFKDHIITSLAIERLEDFAKSNESFLLGVGFKLPHLAMHVPYSSYKVYKDKGELFKREKSERQLPKSIPGIAYRCCADQFKYMNDEGALSANRSILLDRNIDFAVPQDMYTELMIGYASGIHFVDKQLGRLLDTIDKLHLWNNLTIVLTADHGMLNGEKGMW